MPNEYPLHVHLVNFDANGELKRQNKPQIASLLQEGYIKSYYLTSYTKMGVRGVRPSVPRDENRVKVFSIHVFAI